MIERLLVLYPSGYRAAYGREIADTYREMTAGLSHGARLREGADLAAHALRVRSGLGSADPLGRFLASAAPFALAAAAVIAGIRLTRWCAGVVASPTPVWLSLRTLDGVGALSLLCSLLVCVGAIVALTGRWAAGTAAAVSGLAGTGVLGLSAEWLYEGGGLVPVTAVLTIAVVLACPPDLRPGEGASAAAGAMGGAAWLPVAAVEAGAVDGVSTEYGAWPLLALTVTGIVLALRARSSGLRETGAMLVASPPLAAHALAGAWYDSEPIAVLVLVLPVVTVLAMAVRARRRAR
ncbi:hypothetical protein [Streptomyces jumonjinensis]|uniref:hypothetical protein n=1 Tax=Streptomyces jumonjinensis TaxID=1945 RepID=UPI0037881782